MKGEGQEDRIYAPEWNPREKKRRLDLGFLESDVGETARQKGGLVQMTKTKNSYGTLP